MRVARKWKDRCYSVRAFNVRGKNPLRTDLMVKNTKDCQGKWNFTCPVGLQASEQCYMGALWRQKLIWWKREQAKKAEPARHRRAARENGEFSAWASKKERTPAFERSSHSLPWALSQRALVSSTNLRLLIQKDICTLPCLCSIFNLPSFELIKFLNPLPLSLNYYIFKNMLTNLRFTLNVHMDHLRPCNPVGWGGVGPRMQTPTKFPDDVHVAGSWTKCWVPGKIYLLWSIIVECLLYQ